MDSSKDAFEIYGLNLNIFYTCANNKKIITEIEKRRNCLPDLVEY